MLMSKSPINEWVVIFYPQTGIIRLCPTVDHAEQMLSKASVLQHVYRNPNAFRQRHDHHTLETFWRAAYKSAKFYIPKTAIGNLEGFGPTPPDVGTEEFCRQLWDLMQAIGDRVEAPTQEVQRSKEHYELKLDKMRELVADPEYKKVYNKQARTVFEALLAEDKQFLIEEEIREIILSLVAQRRLKTKQEPWVIFQYYRPQFIKDGYVIRGNASKNRG